MDLQPTCTRAVFFRPAGAVALSGLIDLRYFDLQPIRPRTVFFRPAGAFTLSWLIDLRCFDLQPTCTRAVFCRPAGASALSELNLTIVFFTQGFFHDIYRQAANPHTSDKSTGA